MKTGIVILNYNNPQATIDCLRSLYAATPLAAMRVVVVDNGSDSTVVEQLRAFIEGFVPSVTLLTLKCNIGYAQGNNAGLELLYADPEVDCVAIVNNDILFTEDIVTPLSNKVRAMEQCAILSPLLLHRDGKSIDHNCARKAETLSQILISWLLLHRNTFGILSRIARQRMMLTDTPKGSTVEIELPSGSCMVARKAVFKALGSFDPNTFLYYEENILHSKIAKAGLKNYIDTSVSCIHFGAATTSSKVPSSFVARCLTESSRYYIRNYTDAGIIYRATIELFFALFRLKIAIKQRIRG